MFTSRTQAPRCGLKDAHRYEFVDCFAYRDGADFEVFGYPCFGNPPSGHESARCDLLQEVVANMGGEWVLGWRHRW